MSVTEEPAEQAPTNPSAWNFKLLAQHAARRLRRHGRRHVDPDRARRPPHHLARARERAEEFHRGRRLRSAQAQGGGADRPAAGLHALELAGDHRQHDGGRLPDARRRAEAGRLRAVRHLGAGEAAARSPSSIARGRAFARRAPALVLRRRIRPHGRPARADFKPTHPARRPVLPLLRRAQSVEADRSRPLVDARHARRATTSRRRRAKPALDKGNRAHNTNVYPQRPDRCYLAYLDAGMFVMDISDKAKPKPISRFDNSPPYTGFTHTMVPLFDRGLMRDDRRVDRRQRQSTGRS